MGLNVGFNAITTGSMFLLLILLVVTGILFVSAGQKIKDIPEYSRSSRLQNGFNKIQTAYILTFVAAGVALILAIAYGGHEVWWSPSEWVHTLFMIAAAALIIIADVYVYGVLNEIYTPELADRNGVDNFIWAGLWISLLGFLVLLAAGSGRAGYNTVRSKVQDHFEHFKGKVDETHAHITGRATLEVVDPSQSMMVMPPPSAVMMPPPSTVGKPRNQCPGPVVVHAGPAVGPAPPSRTVVPAGPPVRTTHTTLTESRPMVETYRTTMSRTESPSGY